MIYFMQSVDGGPIKIGCTCDIASRHRSLEFHYDCELVILATMEGDFGTEKQIHSRFKHLRLGRTEQFRPEPDLLEFIGNPSLAKVSEEPVKAMPARTPGPDDRIHAFGVRGRKEWKNWAWRFADFRRKDLVDLVDESLVVNAKEKGFKEEPPKR